MAKQLISFSDPTRGFDSYYPAKTGVMKINKLCVWSERMVDFVGQSCKVVFQRLAVKWNVQNLFLLFTQTDFVAVVLPVIKSLKTQ
jgi:hypothetical protein